MYTGSCLCGAIGFEIHGPIRNIVYCHCSECRRVQGSAFATNGNVDADKFRFTRGEDKLSVFEQTPGSRKLFCGICGSPMLSRNEQYPGVVRVRLGTIESDIRERPAAHIFVSSRANWDEIQDDLPQYDGYEPGR